MQKTNMTTARSVLRGLATPLYGLVRYGLTLALFCMVWWYDARLLNKAFDANLAIIKTTSNVVDGSGKSEAMLRAFAAEKMLLFGEGSAAIWAFGCGFSLLMRRLFAGRVKNKNKVDFMTPALLLVIWLASVA